MPLRHLALKTRDLRATERFYVDVLGLETAFSHRGMIFRKTPDGDDLHDNFTSIVAAVVTGRRGRRAVYLRDPNGYTIELYCD